MSCSVMDEVAAPLLCWAAAEHAAQAVIPSHKKYQKTSLSVCLSVCQILIFYFYTVIRLLYTVICLKSLPKGCLRGVLFIRVKVRS
jgi:hypothetical protein